ncbi:MAG: hypothetical protein HY722_03675 [Planctomycetes bacterium]|nr:hypothetical protein [Planctomycetota bacterium]
METPRLAAVLFAVAVLVVGGLVLAMEAATPVGAWRLPGGSSVEVVPAVVVTMGAAVLVAVVALMAGGRRR